MAFIKKTINQKAKTLQTKLGETPSITKLMRVGSKDIKSFCIEKKFNIRILIFNLLKNYFY